jgi:hypothetical protein
MRSTSGPKDSARRPDVTELWGQMANRNGKPNRRWALTPALPLCSLALDTEKHAAMGATCYLAMRLPGVGSNRRLFISGGRARRGCRGRWQCRLLRAPALPAGLDRPKSASMPKSFASPGRFDRFRGGLGRSRVTTRA